MENLLMGAVLSKFRTITNFAKAMEWDRKKASRIINRHQKPTANDMEQMARLLNIRDAESFVRIFLPSVPTMWENN